MKKITTSTKKSGKRIFAGVSINGQVFKNFKYLTSIQGVNMLTPLITLPYLARVLGLDGLGLLATAAATSALFGVLIDWGFNLTAVRAVSTNRDDPRNVSEIFSAVTTAKIAIIIISLGILICSYFFISSIEEYFLVFIFSFTFTAMQALLPTWAFQGLERLEFPAAVNALGKIISTVLLISFVKRADDVSLVPLINSFVAALSLTLALHRLHQHHKIKFSFPSAGSVLKILKDGGAIFIATAAGFVYNQGPIIILNIFTDLQTVGKYSIAQKISVVAVSVFQSFSQAIFPTLSRLWLNEPNRFSALVCKYITTAQLVSFGLLAVLYTFAPEIYHLATKEIDSEGVKAIRYWIAISQLTVLSVTLNPVLVSLGRDRDMAKMYIFFGVAFLLYSWVLTSFYFLEGMLISMIIVEGTIAVASLATFFRGARTGLHGRQ